MSDTIANAPGLDLAPILARADAADIPALVAEVQKLRTALSHAIDVGFVAVGEALREGEEARARILFLESRDRLRLLEIGILGDKRDAALTRLAALESAPTFADGVRAGLGAAADWVDGDDGFDPLIPLSRHMNVAGLSHDARAQIEGILDAVLAGAAVAIREIDPSTVKP